jgi:miniconductance mechanosensitive channel
MAQDYAFHLFLDEHLAGAFGQSGVPLWFARLIGVTLLIVLAFFANWMAKGIILRGVTALIRRSPMKWDDALLRAGFFTRLSHLAPAIVLSLLGATLIGPEAKRLGLLETAVSVYLIVITLTVFFSLVNAVVSLLNQHDFGARVPLKGIGQAVQLVAFLIAAIFMLATILDKTPLYLLSGLGAMAAVLMLVFRDALLGFTAGIMLSTNEMVRIGDWIEMPKAGADGDVIDISLTTVKVRNWDKTITTIPAYSLISDSFKNWRGMQETGGRRIKRAIPIDMQSVRFADEALVARWMRIRRLRPYLESKLAEVKEANLVEADADLSVLANGRRLTNLGTFRAYCIAYLRQHPHIHQDMTFLIRQLAPTEHGLPLELYVFTNDIRWANYEAIQADIFDHLLAVIGEFDLRVFQAPSGRDFTTALAARSSNQGES